MYEILINPILIGLVIGCIVYIYLRWKNKKKYKINPELKNTTGIITPIIFGILGSLLSHYYLEENNILESLNKTSKITKIDDNININNIDTIIPLNSIDNNIKNNMRNNNFELIPTNGNLLNQIINSDNVDLNKMNDLLKEF